MQVFNYFDQFSFENVSQRQKSSWKNVKRRKKQITTPVKFWEDIMAQRTFRSGKPRSEKILPEYGSM